jgi:hypothetical protein
MLDIKDDKSLWEKQHLDGVGNVLLIEESYYDGIIEMVEKLQEDCAYWKMKHRDLVNLKDTDE